MTKDNLQLEVTTPESGLVYSTVTRYWPRIAAGLVVVIGGMDLVLGGLTSDSSLEFYLMAWGATTGGLWFLSDRAENALSEETRSKVVRWLHESDYGAALKSMPSQFVIMFDRVFSERHWSLNCFLRSCLASISFVAVTYAICRSFGIGSLDAVAPSSASNIAVGILFSAVIFNVVPDYLSLLETRWLLGVVQRRLRMRWILVVDALITFGIFAVSTLAVVLVLSWGLFKGTGYEGHTDAYVAGRFLATIIPNFTIIIAVLASTFFTSIWLWLYAISVPFSRLLLHMNSGVGFLLRVTDVEEQPFRSMGFTSVVLVSLLFLVGLPFVLLA